MVVSKDGNYTKHIYIGNQRIVSKLGDLDSYGQDPRRIELGDSYAVSDAAANKGTIKAMNGNSSLIKSLNGTKIAGRSLVVIAAGLDAYEIYTSENRARTITSVVGGWTGAWAGATLGAEGGAIIGAACGAPAAGVGAAPGAVVGAGIGSLIGGVAGYFVGREITETVYDLVTTSGFKIGGK